MKSVHAIKGHLLRITAISRVLARLRVSDHLKERAMTDVVFFVSGRHGAADTGSRFALVRDVD